MAKALSIGFKLTENSKGLARKLSSPSAWAAYKKAALQTVTEGAKAVIQQYGAGLWKNPTGALDSSWFTSYDFEKGSGTIYNTKHYAYWLNFGVRRHQMTYLLNGETSSYLAWGKYPYEARRPIPLVEANGGRIFRRATTEDMIAGKWWHPGFPALHFLEKGAKEYEATRMPRDLDGLFARMFQGGS